MLVISHGVSALGTQLPALAEKGDPNRDTPTPVITSKQTVPATVQTPASLTGARWKEIIIINQETEKVMTSRPRLWGKL